MKIKNTCFTLYNLAYIIGNTLVWGHISIRLFSYHVGKVNRLVWSLLWVRNWQHPSSPYFRLSVTNSVIYIQIKKLSSHQFIYLNLLVIFNRQNLFKKICCMFVGGITRTKSATPLQKLFAVTTGVLQILWLYQQSLSSNIYNWLDFQYITRIAWLN